MRFVTTMLSEFALAMSSRTRYRDTIQRIKSFPAAWHPLSASIRRCQLKGFPYGLIYTASNDEILILAVAPLAPRVVVAFAIADAAILSTILDRSSIGQLDRVIPELRGVA